MNWGVHFTSWCILYRGVVINQMQRSSDLFRHGSFLSLNNERELHGLQKPLLTLRSRLVPSLIQGLEPIWSFQTLLLKQQSEKFLIIDPKGTSNRDQGPKNQREKNKKHIFCKIWSSFTNLMVCHGTPWKAYAWLEEDCSTQVAWCENRRFMCIVKMSEAIFSQLQVSVPSKRSRKGFSEP